MIPYADEGGPDPEDRTQAVLEERLQGVHVVVENAHQFARPLAREVGHVELLEGRVSVDAEVVLDALGEDVPSPVLEPGGDRAQKRRGEQQADGKPDLARIGRRHPRGGDQWKPIGTLIKKRRIDRETDDECGNEPEDPAEHRIDDAESPEPDVLSAVLAVELPDWVVGSGAGRFPSGFGRHTTHSRSGGIILLRYSGDSRPKSGGRIGGRRRKGPDVASRRALAYLSRRAPFGRVQTRRPAAIEQPFPVHRHEQRAWNSVFSPFVPEFDRTVVNRGDDVPVPAVTVTDHVAGFRHVEGRGRIGGSVAVPLGVLSSGRSEVGPL